jgi:DNA adenine methylase
MEELECLNMKIYDYNATPFLKWIGGKSQLLDEFLIRFPDEVKDGTIRKYVEPFIGGGAVFFDVAQRYDCFDEFYISDMNEDLITSYNTVKNNLEELIIALQNLETEYMSADFDMRSKMYYRIRKMYNKNISSSKVERASQLIFLNKTCFNGLFRVNTKGEYNAAFGKYDEPNILDEPNLRKVSELLGKTNIHVGDFTSCESFVDDKTFVYFDPPYRPIKDVGFTSYSKERFTDKDHICISSAYISLKCIVVLCEIR